MIKELLKANGVAVPSPHPDPEKNWLHFDLELEPSDLAALLSGETLTFGEDSYIADLVKHTSGHKFEFKVSLSLEG